MAIPKGITKDIVIKALEYIDKYTEPKANKSDKYHLIKDGKPYSPKYVIAVARPLATQEEISTKGLNAIEAKTRLDKLGFEIQDKTKEPKPKRTTTNDSTICSTDKNDILALKKVFTDVFDQIQKVETISSTERGDDDSEDNYGYSHNKAIIRNVFDNTTDNNILNISTRLYLIDGMYSTQMSKRYYAIDDLTKKIWNIQNQLADEASSLEKAFVDFAENPKDELRLFNDGTDNCNLWSTHYGIGKDGEEKGMAISLISKYAYFETGYRFPIYDTIACEVMPQLKAMIKGLEEGKSLDKELKNLNKKSKDASPITVFITQINSLKKDIEDFIQKEVSYDHLDRLLWFVGKMIRGNFSLILPKNEYQYLIQKAFDGNPCEKCPHNPKARNSCKAKEGSQIKAKKCNKERDNVFEGIVTTINSKVFSDIISQDSLVSDSRLDLLKKFYELAMRLAKYKPQLESKTE